MPSETPEHVRLKEIMCQKLEEGEGMSEIWNKVYRRDTYSLADGPSNFALDCYEEFKKHGVKRILELGCGQGRDTIFFAHHNQILFRPC